MWSLILLQAICSYTGRRRGFNIMRAIHILSSLGGGSNVTRTSSTLPC